MTAMAAGARWLICQASVMPSFLGWTALGACGACAVDDAKWEWRSVQRYARRADDRWELVRWGRVSGSLSIPDAHDRGAAGVERTCHSGYGLATSEAL